MEYNWSIFIIISLILSSFPLLWLLLSIVLSILFGGSSGSSAGGSAWGGVFLIGLFRGTIQIILLLLTLDFIIQAISSTIPTKYHFYTVNIVELLLTPIVLIFLPVFSIIYSWITGRM